MKKLIVFALSFVLALSLTACGGSDNSTKSDSGTNTPSASVDTDKTFGDVIEFDDLEIIFINDITWSTVNNQFSEHNGEDVALVPLTIKNVKDETHGLNMFYYTQYGSKGTKLDGIGSYFDGEVEFAGDMRSGATQETFMAFLYDGDGDYFVEFSELFGAKTEVKLPIIK